MSDERNVVVEYISERFAQEDDLLKTILKNQEAGGGPMMNIGPDQGKFLGLLVKLLKPSNVLEVGSYYGYSSVWLARALTSSCKLHCIEVSSEQCRILEDHFKQAGLEDTCVIHHGSGIDIMQRMIDEGKIFEMIFIDADKANYSNYLDLAAQLLPSGGLLLVDNCLWSGKVVDPSVDDKQTQAIRDFNDKLAAHPDFDSCIVTIQDGLAFAVRN
ncbi:MAG: O-methyltransferase [Cyanobacteria bacterium]|nr:O-methyltransferase [Cyanobacteriota bacterium]MDA1020359.1 O-methyltransferase [Cyanobacteriota bacterium]